MATFVGPAGQVLIFRPLYAAAARGSLLGTLEIEATPSPADNVITGLDFSWMRPANTSPRNRLYSAGWPNTLNGIANTEELQVNGQRYNPPPRNMRVLGLQDGADVIDVEFADGGIDGALPNQAVTQAVVSLRNAVIFNAATNPRAIKMKINAKTGEFTGSLRLVDDTLLPVLTRPVSFRGALVGNAGEGYFILNQVPTGLETAGTSPQFGGRVEVSVSAPAP
jgi:hypothetical protein